MLKCSIAVKALIKKEDSFLIVKTKESEKNDDLTGWETPGGRLEEGEEIIIGLEREIKEETGLSVNILYPFNTFGLNMNQENALVGINYLAEYIGGNIKIDENEHSRYRWATISEIKKLDRSAGLQKEISAYCNFIDKIHRPILK